MEVVTEKPKKHTVPEGYKRTEIGVIPDDWELLSLDDLTVANGLIRGPFGGALKKEYFVNNGYKVYQQKNAIYRNCRLGDYFVDKDKFRELSRFEVNADDFIVSCSGTIGEIFRIPQKAPKGIINQALLIIRIDERQADKEYFYQYFAWDEFQERITDSTQGGAMKNLIGMDEFRSTLIPLPATLEEQRAIAEALSDVDALIAELDAFIEKKKQVKKGAMQQLLTGKKRLPGFEREWEEKTFDECFHFLKSGTNSRKDLSENGDVGYIHYGDIHAKWIGVLDCEKDSIPKINKDKVRSLPELEDRDLILADASEDYEGIGSGIEIKNLNGKKIVAGLHTILLRAKDGCVADGFKAHITSTQKVKKALTEVATGTTVYGISKSKLKQVEILLPPTIEEQKAIARILSDMDAEIQSLQAKRAKYQKIKQGMMQELLTGKTRLVNKKEKQNETEQKSGHNWQIDEAVLISVLTDRFGSKEYPIGRFRRTKLSYLVRRFLASNVDQFLKKAAGPYNHNTRYSGPEKIALDNGYVQEWENGKYSGFIADENIAEAQEYFEGWHGLDVLDWLDNGFRFKKNEDLELLTTVDKSIVELREEDKEVSVASVKDVIASHPEWEAKLERDLFSDENIEGAIKQSLELFR